MSDSGSKPRRRRRKKSKYLPILWILTGFLLSVFVALFTGVIPKDSIFKNFQINSLSKNSVLKTTNNIQLPKFNFPEVKTNTIVTNYLPEIVKQTNNLIAVKIYLALSGKNDIRLVTRVAMVHKEASLLKNVIEALLNYRNDPAAQNLIPLNTRLRKVWIKNQTAYLDFSEEFSFNSFGRVGYHLQIYQVVYTATQFSTVKAVYFYLNGKPLRYLGGDGYPVHNPVYPYTSLPKFQLQD